MKGSTGAGVLVIATMVLFASGSMTHAQDLDEQEVVPAAANVFELHETNFDQWVYGNNNRSASARDQLDSLLKLSIGEIERMCSLTEAQKQKLMLAGRGDIKRFLDRVAEARKVFDLLRRDQNNIQEIFQETQPLAATLRNGLFGSDSFFTKSITAILDPEQSFRYRESLYKTCLDRHKAKVWASVIRLDETMGFSADQRQKMIDLIMAETKPAAKSAGQYDSYVTLLKISKIPEAKLRPLFDDWHWRSLTQQFQQARGMEAYYKTQGFLEDLEPPAPAKPVETKKD